MNARELLDDASFFLSPANPVANRDQRDAEALALEILQLPEIAKGRENMANRWKTIVGKEGTAETWARFDPLIEECTFAAIMKAIGSDPNYPVVLGNFYGPPHRWFGMDVPGTRSGGGDGPDQLYSLVAIDGVARYELMGRRSANPVADVPFSLVADYSVNMTLSILSWHEVVFEADGSFRLTLDREPANGRRNHIQTKPDAKYLFIRDCRADWRQIPNRYRIRRLDAPAAPKLTYQQIVERAVLIMNMDVATMYWWMRTYALRERNIVSDPIAPAAMGGLPHQRICFGRFNLNDDEALVLTFGDGGAAFRDIVLKDNFFRTFDYWRHTSNMNNAQGVPNADGSTTYVVSLRDPGVHNWLDPAGFRELLMVHRWQGLPSDATPEMEPWVSQRIVPAGTLDAVIDEMKLQRVSTEERRAQLVERAETFALRFLDS